MTIKAAKMAVPGNEAWEAAVNRAKASGETDAETLYNMHQNVRKRYFLEFLKQVGGTEIGPGFHKELKKAADQAGSQP